MYYYTKIDKFMEIEFISWLITKNANNYETFMTIWIVEIDYNVIKNDFMKKSCNNLLCMQNNCTLCAKTKIKNCLDNFIDSYNDVIILFYLKVLFKIIFIKNILF